MSQHNRHCTGRLVPARHVGVLMGLATALSDIRIERLRQIELWGDQNHKNHDRWYSILGEEFGEVGKSLNEGECDECLRKELIQVAAVAIAWVEKIDAESEPSTGQGFRL